MQPNNNNNQERKKKITKKNQKLKYLQQKQKKVKEKEEVKIDEHRKRMDTMHLDDIASQKSFFKLMNLIG